jgi:hypothetical protein
MIPEYARNFTPTSILVLPGTKSPMVYHNIEKAGAKVPWQLRGTNDGSYNPHSI